MGETGTWAIERERALSSSVQFDVVVFVAWQDVGRRDCITSVILLLSSILPPNLTSFSMKSLIN